MFEDLKKFYSRIITLTFAAAVTDFEMDYVGERIWVDSATADFSLKLNDRTKSAFPMKAKKEIIEPYSRFYITTTGANTLVLHVSDPAEIQFGGNEVNVDTIEAVEKTATAVAANGTVGVAAAVLIAANTGRKSLTIQAIGGTIYLGPANTVTVANGFRVQAGEAVTEKNYTGAIYAIAGGAGIDVRYWENG
uniref:Uncharacterized protein n=1 Tax=viral metagenome TaxID=1070528 RepID=A0A6H1Z6V1_9ZZZZ